MISGRAKKFDELLHRLTKYNEATRKQQRNELLINERASGSNMKMGTQIHRGPSELVTQKSDDRPKNGTLNKRVRTSVAETRVCNYMLQFILLSFNMHVCQFFFFFLDI